MKIPLKQFEQYVDEIILKRGLSYFKKGCVSEPEEITTGVYEAIVAGTEDYTVEVTIKNNIVTEHVCNCPYDMGPVCKHIAAVLFYLQEDVLETKHKATSQDKTKEKTVDKKVKKKTISEQVDDVLQKITHEELKQFVREKAKHNPTFRNLFLSSFTHPNANESTELYAKQIKSILRTVAGREGFIYWNQAGRVEKQVRELLNTAQKQIENRNFQSTFFICTAVMEEMTEALQFADDSNGYIGDCIHFAFELLFNLTKETLPEEIRVLLLDYCLNAFKKQVYSDWDWNLEILNIASEILNSDDEVQRLITCLDEAQLSEYEKEWAQYLKLDIIRRTKGEKEAEKFIEQNLVYPQLRREAIQKAIKSRNYEKAINLSKDGIRQDEKDKPGLAIEWYDWLLKVAQIQKDKEKIIEYARYLFIDNFRNEQDYYQLMKDNVLKSKWNLFVEGLIKDISTKGRWINTDLIANIYIKEKWWNRLMAFVAQNPSLQKIEQYEKHLSADHSIEIIHLYERCILEYLKHNTGRDYYQTACMYLKRMKNLGAGDKVNNMIEFLKKEYAQRRALIEELNMV